MKESLALATLDSQERIRRLTRASGLWLDRPKGSDLPAIASMFKYRGFDEDAERVMEEASGSQAALCSTA